MKNDILEKYCAAALEGGATHAKAIHPSSVVTGLWVRLKCQFGCPLYGQGYCCPPDTPTPEHTRKVLDSYHSAILFHLEAPSSPERKKLFSNYYKMVTDMEGQAFKEGYYKALAFLGGPCRLCKTCGKMEGVPCKMGDLARPSMESTGIDVYQTARNNGFFIQTLSRHTETSNNYCLLLVD